jgi:general stress protein 26
MTHQEGITKVAEPMRGIHVYVLTTITKTGQIVSRPMGVQDVKFDGDLWFFTYEQSNKVDRVKLNPQVNVTSNKDNSYVSLSGTVEIVHDHAKTAELWNKTLQAWFPDGPETEGLSFINVHADSAEYWDSTVNKVTYLLNTAAAAMIGSNPYVSENHSVEL